MSAAQKGKIVSDETKAKTRKAQSEGTKGSSKYTGVCWCKQSNKWKASISINGKHIHLGSFTDEIEASEYYQSALISIENGTEITRKEVVCSSKYTGVSWNKKSNKWDAAMHVNRKKIHLGSFTDEQEAHESYQKALLNKIASKTI
jgi:hypothetical protein